MVNTVHTYNKIHQGDNSRNNQHADGTQPLLSSKLDKPDNSAEGKERAEWAWILHKGFDDDE